MKRATKKVIARAVIRPTRSEAFPRHWRKHLGSSGETMYESHMIGFYAGWDAANLRQRKARAKREKERNK